MAKKSVDNAKVSDRCPTPRSRHANQGSSFSVTVGIETRGTGSLDRLVVRFPSWGVTSSESVDQRRDGGQGDQCGCDGPRDHARPPFAVGKAMAILVHDTGSTLDRVEAPRGCSKTEEGQPGHDQQASQESRFRRCERQDRKQDRSQEAHPNRDLPLTQFQTGATPAKILDFVHRRQPDGNKHERKEDRGECQQNCEGPSHQNLRAQPPELSDAGGPARPHWPLTWPARAPVILNEAAARRETAGGLRLRMEWRLNVYFGRALAQTDRPQASKCAAPAIRH